MIAGYVFSILAKDGIQENVAALVKSIFWLPVMAIVIYVYIVARVFGDEGNPTD
ncbi:hypothetical protein EDC54_11157 [Samsonia erythrinae]|uniref:Uncharacterized protein n=1 Tax=Samsonia erythrinae TaxID=160434 RepID=A0A4R3VFJ0_9GAMM|nr:hypothetical protein EDC54_11157 [Samsonia erythrinae]